MFVMMNLDKIRIPDIYSHTPPRLTKINESMDYYREHGTLKSTIVVTQRGLLLDGYTSYIVASMCGISSVQCTLNTERLDRRYGGKKRKIRNPGHKRELLYKCQNGRCALCGKKLQIDDFMSIDDYLTLDHILPVSKGGSNGLNNLQGLCRRCNHEKKDRY